MFLLLSSVLMCFGIYFCVVGNAMLATVSMGMGLLGALHALAADKRGL